MTEISKNVLEQPLELPCGAILKNRLVKSAMSDSLGDGMGDPTDAQIRLYERWAEGRMALSLIGEVQGDYRFPEKPGNLVLGPKSNQKTLRSLASRGQIQGAHLWPQLGHAGALSHLPISRPKGPSALNIEGLQCDGMSVEDIQALPEIYSKAAMLAKSVGFSGVQIHAGHGFLFNQFISPLFNHRTDEYGGSVEARFNVVRKVIDEVRRAVGPAFPIGIKINSTDNLEGGITNENALEVIRILNHTSIDLIDVSGGTYFPGAMASSDSSSDGGPYFTDFTQRAKQVTNIPVMATGGFERRDQAIAAVASGAVDIVSLARAAVLNPRLAETWLSEEGGDPEFPIFDSPPRGGVTAWYTMRITALGEDRENEFALDPKSAISTYEERDTQRCIKWLEKYS
ncbi:MAG: 2,4-dienoyl-CoA reductase-like NADH-dependent reductase (Old Yellow Enzyme family) [Gammaproteobacteria bacterium]|jgi:2,4-dienoyl-CoA reductase-like NADH-dependent reductase (Old Yellow Enzyme family)